MALECWFAQFLPSSMCMHAVCPPSGLLQIQAFLVDPIRPPSYFIFEVTIGQLHKSGDSPLPISDTFNTVKAALQLCNGPSLVAFEFPQFSCFRLFHDQLARRLTPRLPQLREFQSSNDFRQQCHRVRLSQGMLTKCQSVLIEHAEVDNSR